MNNRTRLSRVDSAKFVLAWNVGQVLIQSFGDYKGNKNIQCKFMFYIEFRTTNEKRCMNLFPHQLFICPSFHVRPNFCRPL